MLCEYRWGFAERPWESHWGLQGQSLGALFICGMGSSVAMLASDRKEERGTQEERATQESQDFPPKCGCSRQG